MGKKSIGDSICCPHIIISSMMMSIEKERLCELIFFHASVRWLHHLIDSDHPQAYAWPFQSSVCLYACMCMCVSESQSIWIWVNIHQHHHGFGFQTKKKKNKKVSSLLFGALVGGDQNRLVWFGPPNESHGFADSLCVSEPCDHH